MVKLFDSLFKRSELQKRGITIEEEVGHGTYSKVYAGKIRSQEEGPGHRVAVKVVDAKTAPIDFIKRFLPRELEITRFDKVHHNNLMSTITDFESNKKFYIITELARFDLLQYLRLKGALRESLARRLFYEMISGINHLHQNDIVHRDIKCENMLISLDGTLKVADFGFARKIEKTSLSDTYCGSTAYTAPEVLEAKRGYDPRQSDTWSCGIILYILLAGSMPFSKNQLYNIIKTQTVQIALPLPHLTRVTDDASFVMRHVLSFAAKDRPRLKTLISESAWFTRELRPA